MENDMTGNVQTQNFWNFLVSGSPHLNVTALIEDIQTMYGDDRGRVVEHLTNDLRAIAETENAKIDFRSVAVVLLANIKADEKQGFDKAAADIRNAPEPAEVTD
jgi:hypothetical protein